MTAESNKRRSASRDETETTSQLRIVHLIKHCGYANGSVHVAVDLACVQARAGHQVTVISKGGTFVPLLEQYGVQHVCLPHDQNRPMDMLRAAAGVVKLVRRTKAHVLHAHMMSSAVVGWLASRLTRVPLVNTVHNSFDPHSVLMRLGDRIVAVSEAERQQLLAKGYPERKLVTVLNAPFESPRDAFMDTGKHIALSSPCILAANALHRRKGVFDLIDACAKVLPEMPEWKLYIAGEGPDRDVLQEQVHTLNLSNRVHFLGFVPCPRPLMEQADIFVLASYADPCSLGVGEARASGCAVVGTAVGGTPETLSFGEAGRLVQPGNVPELTEALRGLMTDRAAREELQRNARAGAPMFHVNRLLGDYDQVYRDAWSQRHRPQMDATPKESLA